MLACSLLRSLRHWHLTLLQLGHFRISTWGFPGGGRAEEPGSAGDGRDAGCILGAGRSPGCNYLYIFCLLSLPSSPQASCVCTSSQSANDMWRASLISKVSLLNFGPQPQAGRAFPICFLTSFLILLTVCFTPNQVSPLWQLSCCFSQAAPP